jgi:hypothetical protein
MKKWILAIVVLVALACSGCEDALLVGGGMAGGAALNNTIEGAKEDLKLREQFLIDLYNQGVEQGESAEKLEEIKQKIVDNRLASESIEGGQSLLGVDWNDPKQTGGAIGLIALLVLKWYDRKKIAQNLELNETLTKKLAAQSEAIGKFEGISDAETAGRLYDIVKEKTANL